MNAAFRLLVFAVLGAGVALAGPPAPAHVVVLDNENLIEGQVTRVEEGYQVTRPIGGEITLPARRVLAVVADRKAAFAVVAQRANRHDADERLRLARWCANHGLTAEALAEAKAAARMRTGFAAADQLVRTLESMAQLEASAAPPVTPARPDKSAGDTVTDVPAIEYNSESFPLFASRVNAILVNTCATCHARDDSKSFRLVRTGGRPGLTKNLMAALAQVNPADPASSPILVKALTPHGTATEAPFKTRTHPAFRTLETWAHHARTAEGTPPVSRPATDPGPDRPDPPARKGDTFGQDSKSPRPQTRDEFDPAIFNEQKKPMK